MYNAQKAKGLLIKLQYQKFQASITKWDVLIQKDQMLWCEWRQMKSFKIMQSLCGRSYMHISIIEIDHFSSCQLCMTWLNCSLKLHIRLRSISSLVPTHITHVYVQWMSYSFVWLYLIKCVAHSQLYVDQIQKDFWVF